jgi:hypothetical protein
MNARLSRHEFDLLKERAKDVGLETVAARYGIYFSGRRYERPCPVCGDPRHFWADSLKGIWGCHKCPVKGDNNIGLVLHVEGVGFREACDIITGEKSKQPPAAKPASKEANKEKEARQHGKAKWLWDHRQPIKGTAGEKYYREARGITCPLPATLGFLPPTKPGHHPAVIAAYAMPNEVEPGVLAAPQLTLESAAVHLTFLKPDGSGKADIDPNKITLGSPGDLPIALAPANDLGGMAFTEGNEDGLSVTGLGVWAAGSAGRLPVIAKRVSIYHVECVTIFAHPDKAGQDGAWACVATLIDRGFKVYADGLLPMTT